MAVLTSRCDGGGGGGLPPPPPERPPPAAPVGGRRGGKDPWNRARNYVYRAAASSSSGALLQSSSSSNGRGRRRRDALSLDQVESVLSFLEEELDRNATSISHVIRTTPRILRRNVRTRLRPTADFLRELYGPELYRQAVARRPDLLVTRGVGYDDGGRNDGNGDGDGVDGRDTVESYLRNELGMSDGTVNKLKRSAPFVFQLSLRGKVVHVADFLASVFREGCGRGGRESRRLAGKALRSAPRLLGLSVESNLRPTADFLRGRCGLDRAEMAKVVNSCPGVLGLSVEDNLRPTIDYLANVLSGRSEEGGGWAGAAGAGVAGGLDGASDDNEEAERRRKELGKCVSKHPQLLALSIGNLRSKVALFDEIDRRSASGWRDDRGCGGIGSAEIVIPSGGKDGGPSFLGRPSTVSLAARVALSAPSTYSLSLDDNILPTVEFLGEIWGTTAKSQLVDLRKSADSACIRSESGLYKRFAEFDIGNGSLSNRLGEYPSILTFSLEGNIRPTAMFYSRAGYLSLSEDDGDVPREAEEEEAGASTSAAVATATTVRARYMATSLYNTLLPRWSYRRERRDELSPRKTSANGSVAHDDDDDDVDDPPPPLHLLAGSTDSKFCDGLGLDLDAYLAYKREAVPRLKFNSQFDVWIKTGRPID